MTTRPKQAPPSQPNKLRAGWGAFIAAMIEAANFNTLLAPSRHSRRGRSGRYRFAHKEGGPRLRRATGPGSYDASDRIMAAQLRAEYAARQQ